MIATPKKQVALTVVLNIWKRDYIEEQVEALLAQTVLPLEIWMVHSGNHIDVRRYLKKYPFIRYIHSDVDLGYFGRYSMLYSCRTTYVWILDDDIMPSEEWISVCVTKCEQYNAIICSNGRIIPKGDFFPEISKSSNYRYDYFVGDSDPEVSSINFCEKDTMVDFGCNSFFFRTVWIEYFWKIWPFTTRTGEDMHLSATCKILQSIPTIVPEQTTQSVNGNLKHNYSCDEHASWKRNSFIQNRSEVLKYFILEKKWLPLLWKNVTI